MIYFYTNIDTEKEKQKIKEAALNEINRLKEENADLQKDIEVLAKRPTASDIEKVKKENAQLNEEIRNLKLSNGRLKFANSLLNQKFENLRSCAKPPFSMTERLQKENAALKKENEDIKEMLKKVEVIFAEFITAHE